MTSLQEDAFAKLSPAVAETNGDPFAVGAHGSRRYRKALVDAIDGMF